MPLCCKKIVKNIKSEFVSFWKLLLALTLANNAQKMYNSMVESDLSMSFTLRAVSRHSLSQSILLWRESISPLLAVTFFCIFSATRTAINRERSIGYTSVHIKRLNGFQPLLKMGIVLICGIIKWNNRHMNHDRFFVTPWQIAIYFL